ncbi:MAG: S8 family peptidase [bacterium]|nr:S8 family peptidase [bacterium]
MRLTLIFLLTAFSGMSQMQLSNNTIADISVIQKEFKKNNERVSQTMRHQFPIDKIQGHDYVGFVCTVNNAFEKEEVESRGIIVGSKIGDIVSLRYPIQQLSAIYNESSIDYLKLAGMAKPHLEKVKVGTNVDSVWQGINLPQSYTGKDVIIGITDWGFDYSSPMFYDTLLQDTRILAAWDQFKISGPAPQPYGYGTEYNTATDMINAGSDTANFYSYATHGTHVAGITGGSGAGTEHRGMAFESQFLFVTFQIHEAAILDAWEWMFNKAQAEGKRLVINGSWGIYHSSALDNTDILAQAMENYANQGVVFVTSAGNNGDVNFHIQKDFANDTIKTKINFYNNPGMTTLWGQSIHMWGDIGNEFSIQLVVTDVVNNIVASTPWYPTASTTSYIDSFLVAAGSDTVFFNLSTDAAYPSNGRPQMRLRVTEPTNSYRAGFLSTAANGTVHYWNLTELTTDVGNWGMSFGSIGTGSTTGDNQFGIGIPACASSTISVAAYSSEFYTMTGTLVGGAEATFSSNGPLMDGTLKPDISAPGVQVASSISSYTDATFQQVDEVQFNGRTYPFGRYSGTSMSSPVVAGIAAIILEANPFLSPQQVKDVIIETARTDSHTGNIPPHSVKWGWGKINAYRAVLAALDIVGENELEMEYNWTVAPNPASNTITVNGLEGTVENVQIISMTGASVYQNTELSIIDVSTLESGVYILRLVVDGKVQQTKFVKE